VPGHKDIRVGVWKGPRQDGVSQDIGPEVLDEFEALGLTVINFDWTKESFWTMSLAGIKTVFCTLPLMEADASKFHDFVEACRKNGVKHFIKTSFYTSYGNYPFPYVKFQSDCDKSLTEPKEPIPGVTHSTMPYTILSSSHLMSTPLIYQGPALRDDRKYITASYSMGVNYVSPNDLARAAVTVIADDKKHHNKVYTFSNSGPHLDKEIATSLAKFYGAQIEHIEIGFHDFQAVLKKRSLPDWLVDVMAGFERMKASGFEEKKAAYAHVKDIEKLIGGQPEDFDAYLANRSAMTRQELAGSAELVIDPSPGIDKLSVKDEDEAPVEGGGGGEEEEEKETAGGGEGGEEKDTSEGEEEKDTSGGGGGGEGEKPAGKGDLMASV